MTWHEGEPTDEAFRLFRAALEPLEQGASSSQYHPRFTKSVAAEDELARAPERLAPLVPLVEFRHRSWLEEAERADTLAFLEANGLAFVSLDSPAHPGLERLAPRHAAATHGSRTSAPRAERGDLEHPRGAVCRRALRLALHAGGRAVVEPIARLAGEAEEVYALFNNNRDDFAPRSARRSSAGSSTRRGSPPRAEVEPPPTELRLF